MSKTRLILGGIKSMLPYRRPYTMLAHAVNARYGYAVWMRHMSVLADAGVRGPFDLVVEMGPGNSIATGVCAVMSGARHYVGVDVLDHLARDQAERIVREIVALFDAGEPIPAGSEFPNLYPALSTWEFPAAALAAFRGADHGPATAGAALSRDAAAIAAGGREGDLLRYVYPWTENAIAAGSADLIFSQAVLEEIPHSPRSSDLARTLETVFRWLRPGGVTCHQIDLGMYGMSPWNIHWTWGPLTWTLIRGKRDNFVNREPLSTYLTLAREVGFEILRTSVAQEPGAPDDALHPDFRRLPATDRQARAAHLVLRRPV